MGLTLLSAPATEPLTTTEAKLHLREDGAGQDDLVAALIKAARERAEMETERAFITQSWRLTLDAFPLCGFIRIPKPPLISVESVKYIDSNGMLTTMSTSDYVVDTSGPFGKISLAYGVSWPIPRYEPNAVRLEFTCGYAHTESAWAALHVYALAAQILDSNSHIQEVTTPGTSGATQPTWDFAGDTTDDGTVTWTDQGLATSPVPEPIKAAMKLLVGHWYANAEAASEINISESPLAVNYLLWPYRVFEAA
jgi:uncharacterized phiE125 gp8 family phage protein